MIRRLFLIGAGIVGAFILVLGTLYYMGGKSPNGSGGGFFARLASGVSSASSSVTSATTQTAPATMEPTPVTGEPAAVD